MDNKRITGVILIFLSISTFVADRSTHLISIALGKLFCGDQYLQPVNGISGDMSCGFNMDMYLVVFLAIMLVAGLLLVINSSGNQAKNKHQLL